MHRIGIILQTLGHFAPIFRQDHTIDHHILERRTVKKSRAEHHKRIKPAARLIQSLGDKIRWKMRVQPLLVLKRIMALCIRHGPALKPAIEHFGYAGQWPRFSLDNNRIYKMLVDIVKLSTRAFLQIADRTNTHGLTRLFISPQRKWATPIAIAGNRPIPRIFQPIAKTSRFDMFGHPVDLRVCTEHLLFNLLNIDKPRRNRPVNQGRLTTPAVGITVVMCRAVNELALLF